MSLCKSLQIHINSGLLFERKTDIILSLLVLLKPPPPFSWACLSDFNLCLSCGSKLSELIWHEWDVAAHGCALCVCVYVQVCLCVSQILETSLPHGWVLVGVHWHLRPAGLSSPSWLQGPPVPLRLMWGSVLSEKTTHYSIFGLFSSRVFALWLRGICAGCCTWHDDLIQNLLTLTRYDEITDYILCKSCEITRRGLVLVV